MRAVSGIPTRSYTEKGKVQVFFFGLSIPNLHDPTQNRVLKSTTAFRGRVIQIDVDLVCKPGE